MGHWMDFYKICRKYLGAFSRENCVTSNSKEQLQSEGRKHCITDGSHSEDSLKEENLSGWVIEWAQRTEERPFFCLLISRGVGGCSFNLKQEVQAEEKWNYPRNTWWDSNWFCFIKSTQPWNMLSSRESILDSHWPGFKFTLIRRLVGISKLCTHQLFHI